jgi:3-oxoacyl-[acyl-carrier-protein] synthase II
MIHFSGQSRIPVITAMGIAAPGSLDGKSLWKHVQSGKTVVARNKRVDTSESGCSFGGEVPPFDLSFLPADLKPKRMARHTQLLLWAGRQIKSEVEKLSSSPSIRIGLGTSCLSMISESGAMRAKSGASAASRYMISQCPPQAAAGALAQYLKTDAEVLTLSTACAAGLDCIGLAAEDIITGKADCVVAGGTDTSIGVTPLAEFVNCGLSSLRNNDPERASRPFDVFADSGVCGEGAGVFLVEEKSAALARGATILAEIAGYGSCIDPDKTVPGSGWPACMRRALESAAWTPAMLDSISAWGPGHPVLDRVEAEVLKDLLGVSVSFVPVYSIKGVIGNPMAAGGPLQVAVAIFSMRDGLVPPNANLDVPIPEAALDLVRGRSRYCLPENVLLNAHGVAGANATLLLRHPVAVPKPTQRKMNFVPFVQRQISLTV